MRWKTKNALGRFTLRETVVIDSEVGCVFAHWNDYEKFPHFMDSVRRTKQIDAQRVLWDVDVAGHQVVWEARIVQFVPEKLVRWQSSWGAWNSGEARFERLPEARTRMSVAIEFLPWGPVEILGARLGLVDLHVRRDLARFRRFVEDLPVHVISVGDGLDLQAGDAAR